MINGVIHGDSGNLKGFFNTETIKFNPYIFPWELVIGGVGANLNEALIQKGNYFRLSSPQSDEVGAWDFVSENQKEALVSAVMLKIHGNMTVNYIKLRGLIPQALYEDVHTKKIYSGAALMYGGFPLDIENIAYPAYQMYFKMIES